MTIQTQVLQSTGNSSHDWDEDEDDDEQVVEKWRSGSGQMLWAHPLNKAGLQMTNNRNLEIWKWIDSSILVSSFNWHLKTDN